MNYVSYIANQVSKESTEVVGKTVLMQTDLFWVFTSSDRLVEILLGKVSILEGSCSFKIANLMRQKT